VAQRAPHRPTARIEEAIGFVGTFGALFLGVTVFCELTGRPALGWALTLLVCVLLVVGLDRWRVRVLRRHRQATGNVDGIGAAPVRTAPRADGGHAHVGWDELGPGGRRPVRGRAGVREPAAHEPRAADG